MLMEALAGVAVTTAFALASRTANGAPFIAILVAVILAAGVSGYQEPSAMWVWVHAPIIMWPELLALPIVLATCRGFECGGVAGFLILASLFTAVLVGVSFCGFLVRRRVARPRG